jgi:hypothetical protein
MVDSANIVLLLQSVFDINDPIFDIGFYVEMDSLVFFVVPADRISCLVVLQTYALFATTTRSRPPCLAR